ncbi:MAG: hypothetical protein K6E73_00050 [Bacteroidales bacterium]|nr:hypothetical protein [Bacteroidales bacterium]
MSYEYRNNIGSQETESFLKVASFSIIGLLFLLAFSYLEFLGWMYMSNGDVFISNILTIAVALILFVSSFLLPRIKASNQNAVVKHRTLYLSVTLFFFLSAILVGFFAETHFFKVQKSEEVLHESYTNAINQAKGIYPAYQQYVATRVDAYQKTLETATRNKKSVTYKEILGKFPGSDDSQRIKNLVHSLRRSLTPTNQELQQQFNDWLSKAGEVNVWNISFVGNVNMLDKEIQNYINSLRDLSSTHFHPGEPEEAFSYPNYQSLAEARNTFNYEGFYYSNRALFVIIVLIFALCGQWLAIEKSHKDVQNVK